MAKITGILGLSGSAKTLLLANFAYKEYLEGKRIFSNFYLEFDGKHKTFEQREKEGSLNFYPLFEPNDLFKIPRYSRNISLYLDELNSWGVKENMKGGVDSYDYKSEAALKISNFFKTKLRKMHTEAKYTVQQLKLVPVRVREETEFIIRPRIKSWIETGTKPYPTRPNQIIYITERLDEKTGEYYPIKKSVLTHPLGGNFITQDMVEIYDTDADILSRKASALSDVSESESDNSNSGKKDPFRDPVTDSELLLECRKLFNHGTHSDKIEDSGRYSYWKGDVILFPPHKQPIIIDAIGTHKYMSDGITTKTIESRNKFEAFSKMNDIDTIHGSKHYLAYYNKKLNKNDEIKKDWFIAPIDLNLSIFKSKNKTPINIKDLTGVMPLKEFNVH